ncbi:hypothetical protein BZG36_00464 [Bifiguratus adelaidae]|uniref:HIG1 domain-containing protein n=1 Tax=Bifiguratus adelaidae TaxID=1938954 RepID=A0A261Y754_9FUNG|nr:hypothetical protein BZG36_00464 [Bifiguratus adelaidae]
MPDDLHKKPDYEEFDKLFPTGTDAETPWDRIVRKSKEEPFVPAGIALTCFALVAATVGFRQGNRAYANSMLRLRVAAQGFTVLAAVAGSIYMTRKKEAERKSGH